MSIRDIGLNDVWALSLYSTYASVETKTSVSKLRAVLKPRLAAVLGFDTPWFRQVQPKTLLNQQAA